MLIASNRRDSFRRTIAAWGCSDPPFYPFAGALAQDARAVLRIHPDGLLLQRDHGELPRNYKMNFSEFEKKIIPACRIKHLFLTNFKHYLRRLIKGKINNTGNKPYYYLGKPVIPRCFVRQEPWEMEYLFMLAGMAKVGILETGRYNGGSALVLSCANAEVPIHSIDIAPKDDSLLLILMQQLNVGANCNLIVGDSQHTQYPEIGNIDLLFIDGDHSFNGCYSDLANWYGNVVPGGHIVLHDCYFGSEVQAAVIEFLKDKKVQIVASPYKLKNHFRYPEGSLCHFIKLS